MSKYRLKSKDVELRRVVEGPVQLRTAYGTFVIPAGTFVIEFGDDLNLAIPIPAEAVDQIFDLSKDQRDEWGLDDEQDTKMVATWTGEAVIGASGDFPASRHDTLPQIPLSGIGPASTPPATEVDAPAPAPPVKTAAPESPSTMDAPAEPADSEPPSTMDKGDE